MKDDETVQDVFDRIDRRLTSGNNVPMESARITAEEWKAIKFYTDLLESCIDELNAYSTGA